MGDNLEYLKYLSELGVEFDVFIYDGYYKLNAEQVNMFSFDPASFRYGWFAEKYGVSVEVIKEWVSFVADNQCRGITRKGQRCLNNVLEIPSPSSFNPDIDGCCYLHGRL